MTTSSRNSIARAGILLCLAFVASPLPARAQGGALGADRTVPPTPLPVGSGARAAGMGNAFVAIADDATAVSWNPAGLVQLGRPELSIAGEQLWTQDEFDSWLEPEFAGTHSFDSTSLNFLSFVYPIPRPLKGRNIVLSLSYQRRYDFNRHTDGRLHTVQGVPGGFVLEQSSRLDFDQSGSLGAITPAIAFELTNRLSVGVAVNFWRSSFLGDNSWAQTTTVNSRFSLAGGNSFLRGYSKEKYDDFRGENVTVGALLRINDHWALGARFDTAFTGKANYQSVDRSLQFVPNPAMPLRSNLATAEETRKIKFPATASLGVSYRHSDKLTLAADVSRTDWNDLYVKTGGGDKFSLVDGADLNNALRRTRFDPTCAVRVGGEYTFIPKERGETLDSLWSLRGGLFFEQEPASGRSARRPFEPGDGRPDNFYGVSLGVGVLLKQRINIDLAYQFRWGNGVNEDLNPGIVGFDADEQRHRLMLSAVVYF